MQPPEQPTNGISTDPNHQNPLTPTEAIPSVQYAPTAPIQYSTPTFLGHTAMLPPKPMVSEFATGQQDPKPPRSNRLLRRLPWLTTPGYMIAIFIAFIAVSGVSAAVLTHKNHAKPVSVATPITTTPKPATNSQPTTTTAPATSAVPAKKPAAPKVVPKPPTPKRYASTAAASDLAAATTVAGAQQALQNFASQYNLTVQISSVAPTSYSSTFTLVTNSDLPSLKIYGALFIDEWAKYPTSWVKASKLKSIALVRTFAVAGTTRAAGPDPGGLTMYYAVTYSGDYAREVVHHEFDHLFTYTIFGSYSPSDPTWTSYNSPGFNYGNGGASCYQPNNTCLTGEHPIPGFVTGYGASAIEEDKAELYAYLMTNTYYHHLQSWLPTDSRLANKVTNYKSFISSKSPEMSGSYFDDIDP